MSHIPNSAMPHAGTTEGESQQDQGGSGTLSERAGKIREQATDYARENPKTAIAAGAALAAGVIAAAAIPLVRGRSGSGTGGTKSGGGRKKADSKKS